MDGLELNFSEGFVVLVERASFRMRAGEEAVYTSLCFFFDRTYLFS